MRRLFTPNDLHLNEYIQSVALNETIEPYPIAKSNVSSNRYVELTSNHSHYHVFYSFDPSGYFLTYRQILFKT